MRHFTDATGREVDLTACDREPIHVPGAIQPHGILLAARTRDLAITHASANLVEAFGLTPAELLGQPLTELLGPGSELVQRAMLAHAGRPASVPVRLPVLPGGGDLEGLLHVGGDVLVLELEPAEPEADDGLMRFYHEVQGIIRALEGASDLESLWAVMAREVRRVTGYDRVMVYRFEPDGHGHVVAEDRLAALEPYLGLHYPASDIPRQARALYLRNGIRTIPDVDAAAVALVGSGGPGEAPLDLSVSMLRAVSPVHLQYLRNMAVAASMSIALVVDGALWGLIACHHGSPRKLAFRARGACEIIGQVAGMQLAAKQSRGEAEARARVRRAEAAIRERVSFDVDFPGDFTAYLDDLLQLVEADGIAVCAGTRCTTRGATPDVAHLGALVTWIGEHMDGDVFVTDHLAGACPAAADFLDVAAGVLAVSISKLKGHHVFWFRGERLREVTWGGEPDKPDRPAEVLTPRASFAAWQEVVRGRSAPWRPFEIEAATEFRGALVDAALRRSDWLELSERKALDRLKARFLGAMTHSLRTPLHHIIALSSVLEDGIEGPLNARQERRVAQILAGGEELLTQVDALLDFANLEAGRMDMAREETGYRAPVSRAVMEARATAAAREVDLHEALEAERALFVDPGQLQKIVKLVLDNALKFTPAGGRIDVRSRLVGDGVRLEVADTGIGIPEREQAEVFDRFFQAEGASTGEGGQTQGTGLGLAIARALVEAHGGTIGLESVVGEGSTFWFELPGRPSGWKKA